MQNFEGGSTNPLSALDALAQIEQETATTLDPLAAIDTPETIETVAIESEMVAEAVILDPLAVVETNVSAETVSPSEATQEVRQVSAGTGAFEKFKFVFHYLAVSTAVFVILLVSTNWSAYYAIAMNALNPGAIKASGLEITESLAKSKITVFANEWDMLGAGEKKETAENIKKQLEAEKVQIQEDPFSMKHLIPSEPNIRVGFDITPYENRLIIPKIGKNIPLVDVTTGNNFDFDHMENIFMQELEKGVVRYPGSALPGEQGNSFIFGHSSNYPWMKGNYNDIFALLDDLEFGDQIIVYYNQKKFVYVVKEKKVVKPGDVKALDRDPMQKELSLMTCWPVGTTLKRMLVFAELQTDNAQK